LKKFKTTIEEWFELQRQSKNDERDEKEKELAASWGVVSEILKGLDYKVEVEITNERGTKIGVGDMFTDGFFSTWDGMDRIKNIQKIQSSVLGAIEKLQIGEIVRENVLPSLNTVLNILNSFPDIVSRFKFRRKGKSALEISDEYDVQDFIYVMLKGVFPTLQYEDQVSKVGPSSSRADFTISDLGLFIEVKYISKKGKEKIIHNECLTDIQKYGKQDSCQKIIFFIYNAEKCIDNQYAFKTGIGITHSLDGKEIEIITLIFN
jgi:hypothetical protein